MLVSPAPDIKIQSLFNTINAINFKTNHDIEENNRKLQDISNTEHLQLSSKRLQNYVQQLDNQKKTLTEEIDSMKIILDEIKSLKKLILIFAQKINPYNLTVKNADSFVIQWNTITVPSIQSPPINAFIFLQLFFCVLVYCSFYVFARPQLIREKLFYNAAIKKYFFHGLTVFILCYGVFQSIMSNIESFPVQYVNFRPVLYCFIGLFIAIYLIYRDTSSKNEILIQTLLFRCRRVLFIGIIVKLMSLFISFLSIPFFKTWVLFGYITGLYWIASAFYKQHRLQKYPLVKKVIQGICLFLYGLLLVGVSLGYQQLGWWLIPNLAMTFMIGLFFYSLNNVLIKIKNYFTQPRHKITKKIYYFFGLKKEQTIIEILILRYILLIGLMIYTFIVLSEVWGITSYQIYEFVNSSLNNNIINNIFKFNIVLLLRSIILFCVLMLLSRILAGMIVRPIKNKQPQEVARFFVQLVFFIADVVIFCLIINDYIITYFLDYETYR